MADKVEITLEKPNGSKETVEIPADLWERFETRARELNIPIDELFEIAVDIYLKDKGF